LLATGSDILTVKTQMQEDSQNLLLPFLFELLGSLGSAFLEADPVRLR